MANLAVSGEVLKWGKYGVPTVYIFEGTIVFTPEGIKSIQSSEDIRKLLSENSVDVTSIKRVVHLGTATESTPGKYNNVFEKAIVYIKKSNNEVLDDSDDRMLQSVYLAGINLQERDPVFIVPGDLSFENLQGILSSLGGKTLNKINITASKFTPEQIFNLFTSPNIAESLVLSVFQASELLNYISNVNPANNIAVINQSFYNIPRVIIKSGSGDSVGVKKVLEDFLGLGVSVEYGLAVFQRISEGVLRYSAAEQGTTQRLDENDFGIDVGFIVPRLLVGEILQVPYDQYKYFIKWCHEANISLSKDTNVQIVSPASEDERIHSFYAIEFDNTDQIDQFFKLIETNGVLLRSDICFTLQVPADKFLYFAECLDKSDTPLGSDIPLKITFGSSDQIDQFFKLIETNGVLLRSDICFTLQVPADKFLYFAECLDKSDTPLCSDIRLEVIYGSSSRGLREQIKFGEIIRYLREYGIKVVVGGPNFNTPPAIPGNRAASRKGALIS